MFTIPGEPTAASQARELVLRAFGDLEFEEEGHKYTLGGKNLASVSSIGHRFIAHPFDEELQAERYAQRKGETADCRSSNARDSSNVEGWKSVATVLNETLSALDPYTFRL